MSTMIGTGSIALGVLLCVALTSCDRSGRRRLERIEVSPASSSIAMGTSQTLAATGIFTTGERVDMTGSVSWSSADATIASVAAGVANGLSPGATRIRAVDLASGVNGSASLAVTSAALVGLAVTPQAPRIARGTSLQLTAMGTFSDATVQDLTGAVDWESSNAVVASVAAGLAQGVGVGASVITARDPATGVSGSTLLTVTAAVLESIAVTPPNPSIALGTAQQFAATGTYSDSSTQDLTAVVTWSSTNSVIATISNAGGSEGLASSLSPGATTITATDAGTGINGATVLTVTAAGLVSIAVTPANPSIALGTDQQFTATGTYSDSSTQDLTTAVTWTSVLSTVATISNAGGTEGLASSASTGDTAILAVDPGSGIIGSTTLTVTAAELVSIAITPANPSIALGTDQQFTATGTYTDSSTQDLTTAVTWASTIPAVATISNAGGTEGLATSASVGATTITATDSGTGVNDATVLTVTAAALVSIAVTPVNPSIALGTGQQFTATGTYTDSSTQDLTATVTWSSLLPAVATISNASGSEGLASSASTGATTITALDSGTAISGATTLTVTAAALVSIAVTPANLTILVGSTEPYTATGTYTDSSTQDLTAAVTWSSTSPAVATISNAGGSEGLVSGVAVGSTMITATDSGTGINGSTALDVLLDIAYVGVGTATSAAALDLDVPIPTATVAGDVMVACIAIRPSSATVTPPAGWALVRRMDNGGGAANSLVVYRRVAVAGEPALPRWSFSASTGSAGAITAFRGADVTSPVDVEGGATTANGVTHDAPSVTTTVARTMLITAHAFSSAATWTPPAGMIEAVDIASLAPDAATGISLEVNYQVQLPTGATGARTATASANSDTGNTHAVALSPGS